MAAVSLNQDSIECKYKNLGFTLQALLHKHYKPERRSIKKNLKKTLSKYFANIKSQSRPVYISGSASFIESKYSAICQPGNGMFIYIDESKHKPYIAKYLLLYAIKINANIIHIAKQLKNETLGLHTYLKAIGYKIELKVLLDDKNTHENIEVAIRLLDCYFMFADKIDFMCMDTDEFEQLAKYERNKIPRIYTCLENMQTIVNILSKLLKSTPYTTEIILNKLAIASCGIKDDLEDELLVANNYLAAKKPEDNLKAIQHVTTFLPKFDNFAAEYKFLSRFENIALPIFRSYYLLLRKLAVQSYEPEKTVTANREDLMLTAEPEHMISFLLHECKHDTRELLDEARSTVTTSDKKTITIQI